MQTQMDRTQVISALRQEAKPNSFEEAAFMVFCLRDRARFRVTVKGLKQRMKLEGYDSFEDSQYQAFLEKLGRMGFGTVEKDSRGRVRALNHIKTTLQSIGKAALGQGVSLEKFKQRQRYTKLGEMPKAALQEAVAAPAAPVKPKALVRPVLAPQARTERRQASTVGLVVDLGGRAVRMPIPDGLSAEEVGMLVQRLGEGRKRA